MNATEKAGFVEPANDSTEPTPQELLKSNFSNEIVFAVVGHIGSGTSQVAIQLEQLLKNAEINGEKFEIHMIKVSDLIREWAKQKGKNVPENRNSISTVTILQNWGDEMRAETADYSSVACAIANKLRTTRGDSLNQGEAVASGRPIMPDGKRRAYIVDSIRHPNEVQILRELYQDGLVLIGVVCQEEVRLTRITVKYEDAGQGAARLLMARDAKGVSKNGQRVADAFHLSDYFIDNSQDRLLADGAANQNWHVVDDLSRLVKIITHDGITRPLAAETAMHHAYTASLRSACLSRQVGAALIDQYGNIVSTGANEVPKAGGGVYGQGFDEAVTDHRCAYSIGECSNTVSQNLIVTSLMNKIPELSKLDKGRKDEIEEIIKGSGVGDLLEFSRAVHAEMDALISAGRGGKSTIACRMFVTTYPCHYCARHIVSSGVDEVQYIEPYPKSRALKLHKDSITGSSVGWKAPSESRSIDAHVLFRPFVGVAPRMYQRAFVKDRELKEKSTGTMKIHAPEWSASWELRAKGYSEMEVIVGRAEV